MLFGCIMGNVFHQFRMAEYVFFLFAVGLLKCFREIPTVETIPQVTFLSCTHTYSSGLPVQTFDHCKI